MRLQPPFRPHRRRKAMKISSAVIIMFWVCVVSFLALSSTSEVQGQEEFGLKLAEGSSRRDLAAATTVVYAKNGDELLEAVANATRDSATLVDIRLTGFSFVLSTPLKIPVSASIQPNMTTTRQPVFRCSGEDSMSSLIEFSGTTFSLRGVILEGCSCPGLHIVGALPASVVVTDCTFRNFSRTLEPGRVPLGASDNPEPFSPDAAPLALFASSFMGSLLVSNTKFTKNEFKMPPGRRLLGSTDPGDRAAYLLRRQERKHGGTEVRFEQPGTGASTLPRTSAAFSRRYRRLHGYTTVASRPGPLLDGGFSEGPWQMKAERRHQTLQRRSLADGTQSGYSMPLMQEAANLQPDLKAGPWADDVEAVMSVICSGGGTATCTVRLNSTSFVDNTGVATGALYVMCDSMQNCDIELNRCDVRNNKLLWQTASNLQEGTLAKQLNRSMNYGGADEPGYVLFRSMTPWFTSTYPMLQFFATQGYPVVGDSTMYPFVTGRTLGAVVFHQMNATASEPSMMRVRVVGGSYIGNDGSAIMSTATDFMHMAGGYGNWSGPPRQSADFAFSGNVQVKDHHSGWPAIWLRWARNVNVTNLQVSNSTGALWLDEVRDEATIESSQFTDNIPSHLWLDPIGFIARTLSAFGSSFLDFGSGASHTVKVQMTALGQVENKATVRGCRFKGNPAFMTGVLYFTSSDYPEDVPDNLPGRTTVNVEDTVFANNTCLRHWLDGSIGSESECYSGERPLHISNTYRANIQECRFANNSNGGLYLSTIYVAAVGGESVFDNNQLTANMIDGEGDNSYGGAGIVGMDIGSGGLSISDSNFTRNSAHVGGGALYVREFLYMEISNCRFESNTAETYDGGAVWLENAEGVETVAKFSLCIFNSNTAGRNGGAVSGSSIAPGGTGWSVEECSFYNNSALQNPNPEERGLLRLDQAGGGALFSVTGSLSVYTSTFINNRVRAHAGGAVRVVESEYFEATKTVFKGNSAIMGGAVALSRLARNAVFTQCNFSDNSVVDPWVWPDTSPITVDSSSPGVPQVSIIDPGYGGAVYAVSAVLLFQTSGAFKNNSAKFGGALAIISSTRVTFLPESVLETKSPPVEDPNPVRPGRGRPEVEVVFYPIIQTLTSAAAQDAGLNSTSLPCMMLFAENTALVGGAIYLYDTDSFQSSALKYDPKFPELASHPPLLFFGNTANGGGAVYLEGNGQVVLSRSRFFLNHVSPLPVTGLFGRELDNGTAKANPCFKGAGGGVCIVGQASKTVTISSSEFLGNTAKDGAALYLAEGLDCLNQAGCYRVLLDSVHMRANKAANRGGAIFWMHEDILNIATCPSDKKRVFATDGHNLQPLGSNANAGAAALLNITFQFTQRKPPNRYYGKLTASRQQQLLAGVGGVIPTTTNAIRLVNGSLFVAPRAVIVHEATAESLMLLDGQLLTKSNAYLDKANGTAKVAQFTGPQRDWRTEWTNVTEYVVAIENSVVNDTAWLGVPYTHLPCLEWHNMADTGEDVSSTPYFLLNPDPLNFYTSNTEIKFNVTVHDWLGNPCTGDSSTQPLVIVQADSPDVSGAVATRAANGYAEFTSLRLRAKEGLHRVNLTGQLYSPVRELQGAQAQIYVRPCAINEFLSPKNLDECIPCDPGSFNLNVSAVVCQQCPENSNCAYPDPAACKSDDCKPAGFMVPYDGYWHASFFSEQVLECPNTDSCTYPNRSDMLSKVQLRVWQAAREIQLNASNAVANNATTAALKELLASRLRRLLQVKAINDTEDIEQVLLVSQPMAAEYAQMQCAEGYTGTLCGECIAGYGWRRIATCAKCPPTALNNLYYALVTLLTLSMLAFTIYSSLKEQRRPGLLVGGAKGGKAAKITPAAGSNGAMRGSSLSPLGPGFSDLREGSARPEAVGLILDPADPATHVRENPGYDPQYAYMDPAVAAARGTFGSAPGTPKNKVPFPVYDPAVRAHSVVGVPMRGGGHSPHWSSPQGPRRPPPPPWSRVEFASGSYTAGAGRPFAGGSYTAGSPRQFMPRMARGPVAEATSFTAGPAPSEPSEHTGYTNMLYEERMAAAAAAANDMGLPEGELVEELVEEEEEEERNTSSVEEAAETTTTVSETEEEHGEHEEHEEVHESEQGPPVQATYSVLHPHLPQGVMLQSVPVMQGGSPPRSPRVPGMMQMASGPSVTESHPPITDRAAAKEARRRTQEARERAHQSTVVKIFVSYVQVLALLQNIPLDIPGVVDVYYRINNQAISYPGILVSLDCSLPDDSGVSKAIVRVILTVLAPLYIFAGAIIFFLVYNTLDYYFITPYYEKKERKKRRKRHRRLPSFRMHLDCYLGRHLIVTFITIFFFFYPSVVQSLMTIFNCQDVNTPTPGNPLATGMGLQTERVWSQDFGLECYTGPHLALALGLGVPGILLIALGWPVLSALFMTGKLPCMNNIRFTEDMVNFFLADFKRKFAWWESLIMLRKLLIAVIVTLLDAPTSAGVQLLLVVCVLVIAMGIHLIFMPYRHLYTNNLELFSLGTLLATLYLSLYFSFSNSISDGGRITISVLILVINIAMIIIFAYYIMQAYYYAALYNTGLSDLDRETRRKLTQAELQRRILENLTQPSTTSMINESAHGPERGERTSAHHVASIYAAAVWASMRVGSTTNKVLTRVRTLLPQHGLEGPPSRPPSRDGSFAANDPLERGPDAQNQARAGSLKKTESAARDTATSAAAVTAVAGAAAGAVDDPETGLGSGSNSRRTSHAGGPQGDKTDGVTNVNGKSRSRSTSSSGRPAGKLSQTSSEEVAAAATSAYGSSSGQIPALPPSISVREGSCDSTSNPRQPTTLDVPSPTSSLGSPPPISPPPISPPHAPGVTAAHRQNGVRSMSRLAVATSGSGSRSGELLPPPPSFLGANRSPGGVPGGAPPPTPM